jgi:CHASE2 domain-containing sensor protein/nitrogen-specific signal transduction histidine kinase
MLNVKKALQSRYGWSTDRILSALILAFIAIVVTLSGALERFDNLHYDLGRYLSFKPAPKDIVIVAIDEASLNEIGRWPWTRTVHADLINQLSKENTKAIAMDIIFSEPESNNPQADELLAQSIANAGNVILPELLETSYIGAPIKVTKPINLLASHAKGTGRVHVPLDLDGIARGIYLWEGLGDDLKPHFSQVTLQTANQLPTHFSVKPSTPLFKTGSDKSSDNSLVALDLRRFNFLGAPGHFQHVSYIDVLRGVYPESFFNNKIILVGVTAAGLGDSLPTPVSALSQPMPGVEFHANVIASMRDDAMISLASKWASALFCAVFAAASMLFLPKHRPLKALLLISGYYFLVMLLAIALPKLIHYWIPPAGALIAISLAYPIWSWRKLESAQTYLDSALLELQKDLSAQGLTEIDLNANQSKDAMQSRIARVESASQYLRESQQKRIDDLAFISHDIRAPLAAAIMELNTKPQNEPLENQQMISNMLNRALHMADEFLQSSRAEMVDTGKFSSIEMTGLIQQALDEVYQMAKAKKINITAQLQEEGAWVKGNFGLLQRVIINLLTNAIKYSKTSTNVNVVFKVVHNTAKLSIRDSGPGIAPEKLKVLFKRFSRIDGQYQEPTGSGLGLYFVEMCLKKHGGSISVHSEIGEGAEFCIELPLESIESV